MRRRARHTLGTVERHKVEKWIARRLKDAIFRASNYETQRVTQLAIATELVEMLRLFQEREER